MDKKEEFGSEIEEEVRITVARKNREKNKIVKERKNINDWRLKKFGLVYKSCRIKL